MGRAGSDLVFESIGAARLVVSAQTKFNPSDTEWDRWMVAVGSLEHQVQAVRLLVVTEGGHPTKQQLDRLRAANKKNPPTAIVSDSLALRVMGSALSFVNPAIRSFTATQVEKAFDHLGLGAEERQRARAAMKRLERELGILSAAG
jgi:hypothetical protein